MPCMSNPPRHKESCIRIRTLSGLPGGFRPHYVARLYLTFALYELSSALSLGKHLLVYTLARKRPQEAASACIA